MGHNFSNLCSPLPTNFSHANKILYVYLLTKIQKSKYLTLNKARSVLVCSSFSEILFVFLPKKIKELCPLVGGLIKRNTRIQRSMIWPTISKTMRHWLWVCTDGNKDKRLKPITPNKFCHLLGCQHI